MERVKTDTEVERGGKTKTEVGRRRKGGEKFFFNLHIVKRGFIPFVPDILPKSDLENVGRGGGKGWREEKEGGK